MITNFWHAEWDIFASLLFLQSKQLQFFEEDMTTKNVILHPLKKRLLDPHIKDAQRVLLHLAIKAPG